MRDLETNPIILSDVSIEYKCIRDLLNDFDIEDPELCSIVSDNLYYKPITDQMDFYYNGTKFVNDKLFIDLPFEEYEKYGITNAELRGNLAIGGLVDFDIIDTLIDLYDTVNKLIVENPLISNLTIQAFFSLLHTIKILNGDSKNKQKFRVLLRFAEKNKIELKAETFTNENLTEEEEKQLARDIHILQELEGNGFIQKTIDLIYIENQNKLTEVNQTTLESPTTINPEEE